MELLRLSKIIRIVKRNSFHDLNVIPSPYTAGPPLSCASPPGRVAPLRQGMWRWLVRAAYGMTSALQSA